MALVTLEIARDNTGGWGRGACSLPKHAEGTELVGTERRTDKQFARETRSCPAGS